MKKYLKLLRVKHWLKNGLILIPLFFSMNLLNKNLLVKALLAFIAFSISTSIVYIINDIVDIEKDRKHPIKKNRPLASGEISIKNAYITIAILVLTFLGLSAYMCTYITNALALVIPIIYILINILYSKYLKNIPIIDVLTLVIGFLLRIIYGGLIINVEVSKWLYLIVIFGSFYLGFGKRRNEIIKNGDKSRKVLQLYNKDFLDKNMYVSLTLALVAYTLWTVDPDTIARIGNNYAFWTTPLLMVILQLYSLNIEGNSHGDPIEVILSDKKLLITILFYVLVMIGVIYII